MSPMTAYVVETMVTLLAVAALAIVILFGARKLGVGRSHGPMTLVGRLPLDARRSVYLVRIADQVLVIGSSEAGLTRLGDLPASDLPAPSAVPPRSFADVLSSISPKRAEPPADAKEPGDG